MARRRRERMSEGKKNIIAGLIQEYNIKSAEDIQEALKDLLGGTIQEMMEAELDENLGYDKYERSDNTDYRNGVKHKKLRSSYGEIPIDVPQDRDGDFEPQIVQKRKKDISAIEQKIIAMSAKGMTTRQISDIIEDIYGFEVSESMVTAVTNKILPQIEEWQQRSLSAVYPIVFIDAMKDRYPLPNLLRLLNMAKSSYYYHETAIKQPDKYSHIRKKIIELFNENRKCYGYRRIHRELKRLGTTISEKIVRDIMKSENLLVMSKRQKKYSSYKGEISPEVENVINRDFHTEKPNQKWLTDITEFAIPSGKVYLSPIIDCFDGMVVKWNIGTTPDSILVNKMLEDAIGTLSTSEHPLVHTDRGCHYRWTGWIKRMEAAELTRSMSKKGCSPDNAACEGFFGRLKNEMFYGRSWIGVSMDDFINEINDYITWYNTKRIKQSLGYMSPVEYRHNLGLAA